MTTSFYAPPPAEREALLRMLAAVTFVIFVQAYMVAPILPALSHLFAVPESAVAHIVPAYLIPYGVGR
jgi:predicted MFS family arabinose efflux permease